MRVPDAIQKLHGGLIVSCQAPAGSPLDRAQVIAAMAEAAQRGGAVGVRIAGVRNLRRVRRATTLPIIGIEKLRLRTSPVYITPTLLSIRRIHRAGADIIALDCTARKRPSNHSLEQAMDTAKRELRALIMADVATVEEGVRAVELGADLVSTTLSGYTEETQGNRAGPALHLLQRLVENVDVPIVLEGRVRTPQDVRRAFELGAYAVVVGTAITGIESLTREFAGAAPGVKPRS
jgi:N-acylglucosamine-6-phosphate 2-epimerase